MTRCWQHGAQTARRKEALSALLCFRGLSLSAPSAQQGVPARRHRQQVVQLLVKLQLGNVENVVKEPWEEREALCAPSG